ncbi:DUF1178 family protein [Sphingomonas gilva]|uniref:DUF1178 family protein n=1 Tax=Sphingomonas gilva TaxID=2305907 RepID=A0A396RMS9_9SPHN|nr:DUF1178 family protein [Sphingomonas gilva]RHW16996.1 DUF1178 family protein [Sphingomonas gilva]
MIAFDLRCGTGHVFEAWFASSDAFEDQRARKLVECPVCGDSGVEKAVTAARLSGTGETPDPKTALRALAKAQARALEDSQWVGKDFAAKARAMHDGEAPHARIHGQATPEEAKALVADGVPVAPLPLPVVPPDERN